MEIEKEICIERRIVRILFILYFFDDKAGAISFLNDRVSVIESETKLQKIDFWICYPDHLAAALLRGCEIEGLGNSKLINRKQEVCSAVRDILRNREPEIRWIPMRKYLRGAYEPLDEVMVFLVSRNLARRRVVENGRRVHYELTSRGSEVVQTMIRECQETEWYAQRCRLIRDFFNHLNGFEIRKLQYLEAAYAMTPHEQMIATIETEVRARFVKIFGMEAL